MISFEEVYEFSKGIPGIYSKAELHELYKLVRELPDYACIVEIGVLYGRSASVYLQVAKSGKPLNINLIEPWVVSESDTYLYFHAMVDLHFRDVPFTMWNMPSDLAALRWDRPVRLLHVDGDHSPRGIETDVKDWKDRTASVAVFHDYNTVEPDGKALMFPQIKEVVDREFTEREWVNLGVTDSQAKYRRRGV
jgi:hypothetical protein